MSDHEPNTSSSDPELDQWSALLSADVFSTASPGTESLERTSVKRGYPEASQQQKAQRRKPDKRQHHNVGEQKRVRRINDQIAKLKELLEVRGVSVKKDKYSVLSATVQYIEELKRKRQAALQSMVVQAEPSAALQSAKPKSKTGLDYRSLFNHGSVAMSIAALDGRFLDCNHLFCVLSGYSLTELRTKTVFNLTLPHELQRTFSIVSECMQDSVNPMRQFRKMCQFKTHTMEVVVSISLVRKDGAPLYFHITLVPVAGGKRHPNGASAPVGTTTVASSSPKWNAQSPSSHPGLGMASPSGVGTTTIFGGPTSTPSPTASAQSTPPHSPGPAQAAQLPPSLRALMTRQQPRQQPQQAASPFPTLSSAAPSVAPPAPATVVAPATAPALPAAPAAFPPPVPSPPASDALAQLLQGLTAVQQQQQQQQQQQAHPTQQQQQQPAQLEALIRLLASPAASAALGAAVASAQPSTAAAVQQQAQPQQQPPPALYAPDVPPQESLPAAGASSAGEQTLPQHFRQ